MRSLKEMQASDPTVGEGRPLRPGRGALSAKRLDVLSRDGSPLRKGAHMGAGGEVQSTRVGREVKQVPLISRLYGPLLI